MINTGYHNYEGIARIEFDTLRGKEVKCTISRIFQQQAAPLQIFKAVGNPLTISMLGGEDTFRTIKGSEATLRVHNVENFAALGLLAKGNKDYTLTVEYESQVIWRGFMQPDQWNEPFNATPYPSEFRFIDGLSLLKELPFADADGCYFRGYFRDFQIIGYCLSQIGLRRNFVDQINLIDQNTDSADIAGTLFEKIKNVEAFRGMSCYDVIENILKSYGARIEYANEKYYIRRIDSSGNERSVRYDIPPNSFPIIVEGTVENFVEEITCANEPEPTRISWLNSTQELFRLPGVKTLKINQDYGVKPSIFPRSGFEECDFDSNGNLRYWTSNGIRKRTVEGETVVEFREWVRPPSGPGPYTPPAFIEAFTDTPYSGEGNVSAATGDLFEIDFVFRNVNYQAFDAGRYRSPRRPSLVLNTSRTQVQPATGTFENRSVTQVDVVTVSGQRFFRITQAYFDIAAALPTQPFTVIFRNEQACPEGYEAGVPYWFRASGITDPVFIYFRLNETLSIIESKVPAAGDVGETFDCTFFYSVVPVNFVEPGGADLTMGGAFLTEGRLMLDINRRDIYNNDFFGVGAESNVRILGGSTINGALKLRVEKIKESFEDDTKLVSGAWQLAQLAVQFKDTPTGREDETVINDRNRGDYELDIMFAETPIKNNFRNNILKFYNNLASNNIASAPGLQYIHGVTEDSDGFELFDYIKNLYTRLLKDHRFGLAGNLFSDNITLPGKIFVENFTQKRYIATELQWDVARHENQITLHETGLVEPPEPIGSYGESYSNAYDK